MAAASFTHVYNFLDKTGQSGFLIQPKTKFLNFCYKLYRLLMFVWLFIYMAQHVIFVALNWGDMDKVIEGASFTVPHMNCCVKWITLILGTSRLHPIFDADSEKDAKTLEENKKFAHNLHKKFMNIITVTVIVWLLLFILKKLQNDNTFIASYFPFETKSWKGYMLGVFIETAPFLLTGHGHLSYDILIVTYYIQARTQLKIIRNNLENLCEGLNHISKHDQSSKQADVRIGVNEHYVDDLDENVHKRFVRCVKRYKKVVWYTNEVTEIFSPAILFQFFSIAIPICFMVIKLSSSNLITSSLYLSQWESLTPKFRRLILIAAERWRCPIKPRVAYVIPLSMNTFISIVKSVYTLFTVLKTTNLNII
ncbi:uncharacterized protein LOC113229322 [Hyposmocoma kahamanoa]|uniref:uncharacterized protein LOC113229322 n=1 Tax=Hyposmocoma kahamanoa TaxID=1477025 RepID=UPI000E6D8E46|nr:uncharacterized protein LOC113229322 [Hyposmocoma kahamanoa]